MKLKTYLRLPALALTLTLASGVFQLPAFASDPASYDNGVLTLGTAAFAKELCSCVFITGQSEQNCLSFARIPELPPLLTSVKINRKQKFVRVRSVLFWKAVAKFVDERTGCVLN